MRLMPIVYVSEMARSVVFYRALGLEVAYQAPAGVWTELRLGDAVLGLHGARDLAPARPLRVELAFVASESLEALAARLRAAGVRIAREIADEAFGRSLVVEDPDGLRIQINEHDAGLSTRR